MPTRKLFIAALLFLALGAYVYFFELSQEGKSDKLLRFSPDEIAGVVIGAGEQEISLQREESGKWKITSPIQAAADDSVVGGVLSALSGAAAARTLVEKPSADELKSFGLERPSFKVSLTTRSGLTLPGLWIGGRSPVGSSVYVQREAGSEVLLTDASLLSSVQRSVKDFRDRRIVEFKEDEVRRLRSTGQKEWLLTKKGEDWFFEQPKPDRADALEVSNLLAALRFLSAEDFIEGEAAERKRYGLDPPRLRLTLAFARGQREISFGGATAPGEVYLALDSAPTIYTVRSDVFKMFDRDWLALRDKTVLPFSVDQVARLKIDRPVDSIAFLKAANKRWTLESPGTDAVVQETVAEYLRTLRDLKTTRFVEDDAGDFKRFGLERPSLRIALESQEGKDLGNLLVGAKTGREYYARRENSPTIYAIDEGAYGRLDRALGDFVKKSGKDEGAPPARSKKP